MRRVAIILTLCLCATAQGQLAVTHGISGSSSFANGQIATPSSTTLFTGLGLRLTRLLAFVYVDSAAADDTGNGITPVTPKKTLSAAQALIGANGATVFLKRDGYWREQFNIPANNVTLTVYGTGEIPVIDGADPAGVWTQPDAVTYPNVWSQSWTRASATTTSEEKLGYWEDGVRPRYASDATTDLQNNGGWFCSDLTAQTSTVSIKSAADPNTDGIVREITKRHYGIAGHSTTLGTSRTGQTITGPIEIKRCVGHYNAHSGGPGVVHRMLLRDGNVHHTVTEGALTEDVIATEISPQTTAGNPFVAYRSVGTDFAHTFRRCLALFPGGASRVQTSAFYGHGSSPATIASLSMEGCLTRGVTFGSADASNITITGGYAEDPTLPTFQASSAAANIRYLMTRETASSALSLRTFRRTGSTTTFTAQHCSTHLLSGGAAVQNVTGGTKPTISNTTLWAQSGGLEGGEIGLTNSIVWVPNGRAMNNVTNLYTGDYNVFYSGQVAAGPAIHWNGTLYNGTFGTYQAASGQDANSVFCKAADQVSGNGIAFWLGVANGENAGPPDGDFRINPSAKVYKGDGTSLTGLFADGVTPITQAGAQYHWNFNTRTVAAGPPTRPPVLPATVAEARTYVGDPPAWNFYP